MGYQIGADVGGTFTDVVALHEESGKLYFAKVLTTPENPDDAIIEGVRKVIDENGIDRASVAHVVHGTTLFTNALIERKGAKTALITTKGFRDAIEIGREHRYDMYDLFMERPAPIAPRHRRFEVNERVLADGSIRTPIDMASVEAILDTIEAEEIEAVAICLINAYANDQHEQAIEACMRERLPDIERTLSSDLVPEIREYDRTSTTLANVYVKGIAQRYLTRLQNRLRDDVGLSENLFVMQSNGGVCAATDAAHHPILCVESGPAAGALAARAYGAEIGARDVLSFDMGGTTAKACVIADGEPLVTNEFEVDRQYLFRKGSGLPVKVPVIEMIEIGTGGGSIAKVDALKRLQVGPQSAGSVPGPVAYNRGGTNPTITDADLMLGYLDPAFFLGGTMALDLEGAKAAIVEKIAEPLSLDPLQAAFGIHQMANENMASAARIHAIERGKDVRKHRLFAFGGAGPVHAFGVAKILNAPTVIYPLGAGVMSAIGFLTAPLSLQFVRSQPATLEGLDWDAANAHIEDMENEAREALSAIVDPSELTFKRFADMRYQKQGYEVRTPMPDGTYGPHHAEDIKARFEHAYKAIYENTMEAPVEIVSWRVAAYGPTPPFRLTAEEATKESIASVAIKQERPIYLPSKGTQDAVSVYDRYLLKPGMAFEGPAIIEERESTVVINDAAHITVDRQRNLIVDLKTDGGTNGA